MKNLKNMWRLIAKSLGEKASDCDKEADRVALIRLLMFLSIFITNSFIVANALRHWNDKTTVEVYVNGIDAYQTPPAKKKNKPFEFE